jgi:hypothetical protein
MKQNNLMVTGIESNGLLFDTLCWRAQVMKSVSDFPLSQTGAAAWDAIAQCGTFFIVKLDT